MAWDEGEAQLMREGLEEAGAGPLEEKRMFGGLCFLLDGNMVGGISGKGGALMRVGKDREGEAADLPGVAPMIHGGRRMGGFVEVSPEAFADDATRAALIGWSLAHAAALPPK